MSPNHITNIAIIGAGGRFGTHITNALLTQRKHTVTAITRLSSKTSIPPGVHAIKQVDYDSHSSLVAALRGQEALIITMSHAAQPGAQKLLIAAAKDAGVQWIMPNEYGYDPSHDAQLAKDSRIADAIIAARAQIEEVGLNWVGLACGFWYEFSLGGTEARYGFDFGRKTLTLFDDGNTKIPTSTWPQAALAVAKVFALPIEAEGGAGAALSGWRNRSVYVDSFFVSQRDMLASVLRVTGGRESDWSITYEPSGPRYARGVKMMDEERNLVGFILLLYTRVFFPDGAADFTAKLDNKRLGLPEESLDDATNTTLEMVTAEA